MLASELNESKLSNSLAALGLAAGVANANTGMTPVKGVDTKYGGKTTQLFQQRYNRDFDANHFAYAVDELPDKFLNRVPYDSIDVENTKEKILSTPAAHLTKYGKEHADIIAKYVVDACYQYDIDVNVLLAIFSTETGFNQEAVSHTGVRGIGQITSNTLTDLKDRKKISQNHSIDKVRSELKAAVYAAANIVSYYSTHMHDNLELIFAEYNGGSKGGASPYRMFRQGMSKDKVITWMKQNGCTDKVINHFFTETVPYVEKCMKAYKFYLNLDEME